MADDGWYCVSCGERFIWRGDPDSQCIACANGWRYRLIEDADERGEQAG